MTEEQQNAAVMISLSHLRIYDENDSPLVFDTSLSLHQGERVGIVGESGSGKSLTLRAIAGIIPKGLHCDGQLSFPSPSGNSRLAMIFQEPATSLNPTMLMGDFVARTWRLHHPDDSKSESWEKASVLLRRVGVDHTEERMLSWPFELSGGLRQRFMIAAALATEPDVLLCDEPTTALDVRVQAQIIELLSAIVRDEGLSLIFVSHDLAVISQICDSLVVMRQGHVLETGRTASVIRHPETAYTRELLDADLDYRLSNMVDSTEGRA